jgi:serine/threonine protein kinase
LYENPSPNAKLKLCDFGFGQIVEPSVQLTATLGSLYYVAPEVLEGSYGLPCDIWSVGVIVYMLLTGNPPFNGKTDAEVISKVKAGRLSKNAKNWEKISQTGRYFVQSLLRKDPSERFTAAEALQHAWLRMISIQGPGL